ncbi:hypothetical protein ACFXPS_42735 [Nocardia sp. NPDC059091]|uniref:hypothetical protein n=1 Tax=unclassified Nocardia TaxID=2637762 RepID=UPI0036B77623
MHRSYAVAGILASVAAVPIVHSGQAQAAAAPVYFSFNSGTFQCSIASDGTVGCDTSPKVMSMKVAGLTVPMPFAVREVVIDVSWAPGHPAFDGGTPHTLPGGNPDIAEVATDHGQWGPVINYMGATCESGFHASISCRSKGHSFWYYEQISAD